MSLMKSLRALPRTALCLIALRFMLYLGVQASYFIGVMGTITFQMGGNATVLAVSVGILNLAQLIGSFAGGALLDAVGPKRHFAIALACLVTSCVLFQVIPASTASMIGIGAVFGMSFGLCEVISRAYPAYITDDPVQLKHINSLMSTASNLAVVVGPLVGGAITTVAPTQTVFLFALASALLSIIPSLGFRPSRDPQAELAARLAAEADAEGPEADGSGHGGTGRGGKASIVDGFRTTFGMPTLNLLFWVGVLSYFGFGAFDPLESLYYRDVLHVGVEWMGWLSSAVGLGCVIGSVLVLRLPQRHVNIRSLMWVLFLMGLGCLVYVGTDKVAVALAGQVILGIAFGVLGPLENTLIQTHAPLEMLGRVNSVMGAGYVSSGVIPLFLAPGLAAAFGVQGVLIGASCMVAVFPLICMVTMRKRISALVAEEREKKLTIDVDE